MAAALKSDIGLADDVRVHMCEMLYLSSITTLSILSHVKKECN